MSDEYIDLHAHTCFSDGALTPHELIELADKKGLKAVAITDHDTIDGVLNLEVSPHSEYRTEVVAGVELSSKISGIEIHILGYFIDPHNSELISTLSHLKNTRIDRNRKIIEKLNSNGIDITMDELPDSAARSLSRAHIAGVLVEKGYSPNYREAFVKYLSSHDGLAYVERERLHYAEAINMIHEAGGLAFLAHLNQLYCKDDELYGICKDLKNAKMDGIEAYYSEYDENWDNFCRGLTAQFDFLPCGGSDFHGEYKKGLDLGIGYGKLRVPYQLLVMMKERLVK